MEERFQSQLLRYLTIKGMRDKGCTLQDIGMKFNLSRERIRQILEYPPQDKPKSMNTQYAIARKEARKIMQGIHPEIPKSQWYSAVVHHKDENPLNNNPNNLEIKRKSNHAFLHHNGYEMEEYSIIEERLSIGF